MGSAPSIAIPLVASATTSEPRRGFGSIFNLITIWNVNKSVTPMSAADDSPSPSVGEGRGEGDRQPATDLKDAAVQSALRVVLDRLQMELKVIEKTGFISYFLWMKAKNPAFVDEKFEPYTFNPAPFIADPMSIQQGYITSEPLSIKNEAGWEPQEFLQRACRVSDEYAPGAPPPATS